jgi:hypothetical protein
MVVLQGYASTISSGHGRITNGQHKVKSGFFTARLFRFYGANKKAQYGVGGRY